MGRLHLRAGLIGLTAAVLGFGQGKPSFEVASVKPSPPLSANRAEAFAQARRSAARIDPSRAEFNRVSLLDLVARAYRVRSFQVSGPDWLGSERFDISAKLPAGASAGSVPEMLQSLLADRFKLVLHNDSKEFSVYILAAGASGAKLQPKPADYNPAVERLRRPITIDAYAGFLESALGRPVLNQTAMEGEYMVRAEFVTGLQKRGIVERTADAGQPDIFDPASSPSLSDVLREVRTTFSLELRKVDLPVLVIERAEKTPTEN